MRIQDEDFDYTIKNLTIGLKYFVFSYCCLFLFWYKSKYNRDLLPSQVIIEATTHLTLNLEQQKSLKEKGLGEVSNVIHIQMYVNWFYFGY